MSQNSPHDVIINTHLLCYRYAYRALNVDMMHWCCLSIVFSDLTREFGLLRDVLGGDGIRSASFIIART